MAGYFLYSLDWSKFRRFVERPTPTQLTVLTNAIRDQLRTHADQFTADDPCRSWPTDTDALAALVTERLGRSDWYSDLSETAKSVWDSGIFDACCGRRLAIGFRVESDDGVYWDIIDFINHRLGVPPRRTTAITTGAPRDVAMARFGKTPFRCPLSAVCESAEHSPFGGRPPYNWMPLHSMHPPDEVEKMLEELRAITTTVAREASKAERAQFKETLLPTIERVADPRRMLFVQVDC